MELNQVKKQFIYTRLKTLKKGDPKNFFVIKSSRIGFYRRIEYKKNLSIVPKVYFRFGFYKISVIISSKEDMNERYKLFYILGICYKVIKL